MKIKVSKEWCQRSAEIEGESSVGAGAIGPLMSGSERRLVLCLPFPAKCGVRCQSPKNKKLRYYCTREAGHGGWHHDAKVFESWAQASPQNQ